MLLNLFSVQLFDANLWIGGDETPNALQYGANEVYRSWLRDDRVSYERGLLGLTSHFNWYWSDVNRECPESPAGDQKFCYDAESYIFWIGTAPNENFANVSKQPHIQLPQYVNGVGNPNIERIVGEN